VQGTKGAEIDSGLRRTFEPWKGKMKIVRKVCRFMLDANRRITSKEAPGLFEVGKL
jgi:hypothetical protein